MELQKAKRMLAALRDPEAPPPVAPLAAPVNGKAAPEGKLEALLAKRKQLFRDLQDDPDAASDALAAVDEEIMDERLKAREAKQQESYQAERKKQAEAQFASDFQQSFFADHKDLAFEEFMPMFTESVREVSRDILALCEKNRIDPSRLKPEFLLSFTEEVAAISREKLRRLYFKAKPMFEAQERARIASDARPHASEDTVRVSKPKDTRKPQEKEFDEFFDERAI